MTKQEKKAAKRAALGKPDTTILAQPNPVAPTTGLPMDFQPPADVAADVVVQPPAADSVKPPKVKVPFVYDRDAINATIAAEKAAGVVRLHPNKARYVKATATSADQRVVLDNADDVALMLRSVDIDGLWEFAGQHLSPEVIAAKRTKYAGKNAGMVRMNIGNLIRGAIRAKQRAATLAQAAEAAAQPKTEAQQ